MALQARPTRPAFCDFHNEPNGRPIKAEADRESITCHLRNGRSSNLGGGQEFHVDGKAGASPIGPPTPPVRQKQGARRQAERDRVRPPRAAQDGNAQRRRCARATRGGGTTKAIVQAATAALSRLGHCTSAEPDGKPVVGRRIHPADRAFATKDKLQVLDLRNSMSPPAWFSVLTSRARRDRAETLERPPAPRVLAHFR
jgi:hypothetical protein